MVHLQQIYSQSGVRNVATGSLRDLMFLKTYKNIEIFRIDIPDFEDRIAIFLIRFLSIL